MPPKRKATLSNGSGAVKTRVPPNNASTSALETNIPQQEGLATAHVPSSTKPLVFAHSGYVYYVFLKIEEFDDDGEVYKEKENFLDYFSAPEEASHYAEAYGLPRHYAYGECEDLDGVKYEKKTVERCAVTVGEFDDRENATIMVGRTKTEESPPEKLKRAFKKLWAVIEEGRTIAVHQTEFRAVKVMEKCLARRSAAEPEVKYVVEEHWLAGVSVKPGVREVVVQVILFNLEC